MIKTKKIQRLQLAGTEKIENMNSTDARLLALLIDTEGSITVNGNFPKIYVGMRSLIPVETAEKWGGLIYKRWTSSVIQSSDKNSPTELKIMYEWHLLNVVAVRDVLLKIKPYLKIKQKQAELTLDLCDVILNKKDVRMVERKRLVKEIKNLNKNPSLADINLEELHNVIRSG